MQNRRTFLHHGTLALTSAALLSRLHAATPNSKHRIGARQFGNDFATAKRAGMDGLELGVGAPAEKLAIADPAARQKLKDGMQATGLATCSLSLDLLNGHPLFSDAQAPAWVEQCIAAAQDLGATGMLVPFFGQAHSGQMARPGKKTRSTHWSCGSRRSRPRRRPPVSASALNAR